ncbi:transcriptional regulator, TetR family [Pseudarthrobacter enclensis]|uniref:TetR family transcriptional regulator n=1 Tax=Pseudarthrobacter enclensis TaxID=993070 RepID=A0A0V8ID98_9MICC|nr:TetR/AcrR family transcriptional regulator [Pseudarthrobacter enclensis]KSU72733.1 TetR family transcriptional regulator [Pseudarthrobacter enclensis]SCC23239.1 transcriptional regulator, TetR family [Pseudarthrobacter enclensis]
MPNINAHAGPAGRSPAPQSGGTAARPGGPTQRSKAKEDRRRALLTAAASLFAANGFNRVSLEDLGAAAGVSGPAVYRHFPGKQAVLADLLATVSRELLDGGRQVVAETSDPLAALRRLVEFQVDFALGKPDVIRVQDRDLSNLSDQDQAAVRALQRSYVEVWVEVLSRLHPGTDAAELRTRAHATFGLINSTPHSVRSHGRRMAAAARPLLEQMALAALTVDGPDAR